MLREAYTKLTFRSMVWKRQATESLSRRTVALGENNTLQALWPVEWMPQRELLPGIYTVRSCQEEELEELYNGRMGVFMAKDGHTQSSMALVSDISGDQREWLQMGLRVTICSRRMR